MEKKNSPVQWLNLMVSEPYYLFHFLAFFSYVFVRSSSSLVLSPHLAHHLLHREIQAILTLAVLAVIKIGKDETWEAYIVDILFFAKLSLVAISLILDYHLALRYTLIFSEFHAFCSSSYIHANQCFPELSIVYSNKNLSFGTVNLGVFPNAAEKFGISLSRGMGQLPTYILFDNAAEVTRFPERNSEAKSSRPPVTKRLLYKHFELNRLFLEYIKGK